MLNKCHSPHKTKHEIRRQYQPGEFTPPPETAISATVGQHKTWLRILQEHNAEILRTYQEMFWFIPAYCMLPLKLAHRSFSAYIECQQRITGSIEQQINAANFSVRRIEHTHPGILTRVDSIEHAMDVAIGAEGECEEPWAEVKVERFIRASECVLQTAPHAEANSRKPQPIAKRLAAHAA